MTDIIEIFTVLFQSGIGYSSLNTARSALSAGIVFPDNALAGSHPLVEEALLEAHHTVIVR